jgi:hypothetical protein
MPNSPQQQHAPQGFQGMISIDQYDDKFNDQDHSREIPNTINRNLATKLSMVTHKALLSQCRPTPIWPVWCATYGLIHIDFFFFFFTLSTNHSFLAVEPQPGYQAQYGQQQQYGQPPPQYNGDLGPQGTLHDHDEVTFSRLGDPQGLKVHQQGYQPQPYSSQNQPLQYQPQGFQPQQYQPGQTNQLTSLRPGGK